MPSIESLLQMKSADVAKLSRQELARVVSQLSSAANKRLRRLERSPMGVDSRAYTNAMKRGKFSVAGKNQGQLQNEYKRVRQFLKAKTSTVSGWKRYREEVYARIGGRFDSEQAEKDYWAAYRQIEESEKALVNSYGSKETQRYLRQENESVKPLTEFEKFQYRLLFESDEEDAEHRDLDGLNELDTAVIRTMIEIRLDYEARQEKKSGNGSFFTIKSEDT